MKVSAGIQSKDCADCSTTIPNGPVAQSIGRMVKWLETFGDTSQDMYDFYACPYGRWAKRQYYNGTIAGKALVAPLVLMEAFSPGLRGLFWPRTRFPLADAHYAMGYSYLYQATQCADYLARAQQYLQSLVQTRCPGQVEYCWGYPFDWETLRGTAHSGLPLITTIPYCYEAFDTVQQIAPADEYDRILRSIARHVLNDYSDTKGPSRGYAGSYTPSGTSISTSMVVNASAYRAFMLAKAFKDFGESRYWEVAEGNLEFVLSSQLDDGSWLYSMDGPDRFTDHFHTCFVMKALAKIHHLTGHAGCRQALERGVRYYFNSLLDKNCLPIPFSRKPRLVVYRRELYDYAECLNLGLLLKNLFGDFDRVVNSVIGDLLQRWQHPDGFFRTRQLLVGWNNVPMHRWGLSIVFRSLCLYLRDNSQAATASTS